MRTPLVSDRNTRELTIRLSAPPPLLLFDGGEGAPDESCWRLGLASIFAAAAAAAAAAVTTVVSVAVPPLSCTQIKPHAWSHVLSSSSYCMKPDARPAAQ